MKTDAQLKKRDEGRNIGQELLAAAQEMAAGRWARKTTVDALPDGSVRTRCFWLTAHWSGKTCW